MIENLIKKLLSCCDDGCGCGGRNRMTRTVYTLTGITGPTGPTEQLS